MQLSDNLEFTADHCPRDDLLLQITSLAFPAVGEPLMSTAVGLGTSKLLSSSEQSGKQGALHLHCSVKVKGKPLCSLYVPQGSRPGVARAV